VSFWTTMTLGEINPENISRGIVVSVEESKEKTEEILKYEAHYDAIGGKPDHTDYLETFRAWSLELIEKRRKITGWICPFFHPEILQVPVATPSMVRHWKKIRRYAFAFAIINERTIVSTTNNKKLIIIEPADILLALELFKEILTETISEVDKRHRLFYKDVLEDLKESGLDYTTIKRMDKRRKDLSKDTVRLYLNTLVKKNYLTYEKDPEDKRTKNYFLTSQSLDAPIGFDLSKIVDIWKENYANLPKEVRHYTEHFCPEYKNGEIFMKHLEDLYFLDQKIVNTEHNRTNLMFGIKLKNSELTEAKTTKEKIPNNRTQNKYIDNEQKVWNSCCLLTHMDELKNFTKEQVYNKLKGELDEYTIELILTKLKRDGHLLEENGKYSLAEKIKEAPEEKEILQNLIEACKDLDKIHKGSFGFTDFKKYLEIKNITLAEEKLENMLMELTTRGILFQPAKGRFALVRM
ncbi:MAG: hypothetical protein ACTSUR_02970, partial [Candidatus Heimdallarchaeaceae archaeon]